MRRELFKKLFKNIGFTVIIFGLISFAFLADAKSPDKDGIKEKVKEKIIKVASKIKKSEKFEVKGIVKSVDKNMKTLTVLINKAAGSSLRGKKEQEEKFSVDDNTDIRIKDIKLNLDEIAPGMTVKIKGRKTDDKLLLNRVNVETKTFEIQGELKSVDVASRIIKVAVQKARHIESVKNKEVDIKVFLNAKIVKANEKKILDSLLAGERVNLKIIKSGDKLSAIKIVVKGAKAENENENKEEEIKTAAISLTNEGFILNSLEVSKGTKVVWTNNASSSAQISSDPHPLHTDFPEFGTGPALQTGQTFEFTFNKEMTFKYHDHLNASSTGTIIVK